MKIPNRILKVQCFLFISFYINNMVQAQDESEPKEFKKKSYFEVGIIAGTPAFINALNGFYIDPVGLRLSGMYLNKNTNGVQLNLEYKLSENIKTRHNLGIAIGKSQDSGCDYYYLGPVYDFYYKSFFLETGVSKIIHVN